MSAPTAVEGLTVAAPAGSHFEADEKKGFPVLTWDTLPAAVAHVGEEPCRLSLNGTSLYVTYRNIGDRMLKAGKSYDEIAEAQIKAKPGTRSTGSVAAASKRLKAAVKAGKIDPAKLAALLDRIEQEGIA